MKHLGRIRDKHSEVIVQFMLAAVVAVALIAAAIPAGGRQAEAEGSSLYATIIFEQPEIERVGNYDLLAVKNCGYTSTAGEPMIPTSTVFVLIPPGRQVEDVKFYVSSRALPGTYHLPPAQPPANIYYVPEPVEPDADVYTMASPLPATPVEWIGTVEFRGYTLGQVKVYPIRYVPETGAATFIESVQIELITTPSLSAGMPPGMTEVDNWIAHNVVNPEILPGYASKSPASSGFEYLIITRDLFSSQATDLKNYKDAIGVPAAIETVDDIVNDYSGSDIPEKVRNCIIDYYNTHGIQWVLLMGDADDEDSHMGYTLDKTWEVPTRYMYNPDGYTDGWEAPYDDYTPTDYYYAGLTGSWDADGDGEFGESSLYSTVDEADWYPEVYVGRITARDTSVMDAQVRKIKNHPGGAVNNMLMCGAVSDDITDEMALKEHIQFNYVPPAVTVFGLYESALTLTEANVIAYINSDQPEVMNSACHGSYYDLSNRWWPWEWYSWFDTATPASLTNDPFLWYADACLANGYDNQYGGGSDCVGERIVQDADGTAIAFVGATRVSWYYVGYPWHVLGLNGMQDWLFWEEFFPNAGNPADDKPGTCLYNSKVTYIGTSGCSLTSEAERKNLFAYQLLGDPEISITAVPPEPSIDVEKKVWDAKAEEWVEEICALLNDNVTFNCTIHNDGTWRDLNMIVVTDILSESLAYAGNARVDGEPWEPAIVGANEFVWEFPTDRVLPVGESIFIEFDAAVVSWSAEPVVNLQMADAWCEEAERQVHDEDTAAVRPCIPCEIGNITHMVGDTNLNNAVNMGDVTVCIKRIFDRAYDLEVTSDGCCPIITNWTDSIGNPMGGTVPAGGNQTFYNLPYFANVTLSANDSDPSCNFNSWSGGVGDPNSAATNVTMTEDKCVTANCQTISPLP
ncbi:MAG: C25 family cysteine peptidase [Dehalococcoidia bacterium]